MLSSCNSGDKKISQIKIAQVVFNSIKRVEKPNFNSTKNFVLGKFDYKSDSTFLKINPPYSSKELYLNIQVTDAFLDMYSAAKADEIDLKIAP